MKSTTNAVFLLENGHFIECNEHAVNLIAAENKEAILGKTPVHFSPRKQSDGRESGEKARDMIATCLQIGFHSFEWIMRRVDGELFPCEITLTRTIYRNREVLYASVHDLTRRKHEENLLKSVAEGVSGKVGQNFINSLTRYLATVLNMDFVYVGILEGCDTPCIRTLGVFSDGETADNFEYGLAGTPCEKVIGFQPCIFTHEVSRMFPEDRMLQDLGVEAYAGIPLDDSNGRPIGILGALSRSSIRNPSLVRSVLQIFAVRAGSEIERIKSEESLRKLSRVVELAPAAVIITDLDGQIEYVNPRFVTQTGYESAEVEGTVPGIFLPERAAPEVHHAIWQALRSGNTWSGEFLNQRKDGEPIWEYAYLSPIKDANGMTTHYLAVNEDITIRKNQEATLFNQARFDSLTHLPNRLMAVERIDELIHLAVEQNGMIALMFIDLDRFKNVNDSLGHDFGDLLLVESARRISGCVRTDDLVARLGGDEFLVVLPSLTDPTQSRQVADKILRCFSAPFLIEYHEVFVSASIGITTFPQDGGEVKELLKNADAAMYRAKSKGRNAYHCFTPVMNQQALHRLKLENHLRYALERNEFSVVFQPVVDPVNSRVVSVEALLRWNNVDFGAVPPDQFIPIAEETGLISEIGQWVLETACMQLKEWHRAGFSDLRVAINISCRQFYDSDLTEVLQNTLDRVEIRAESIELEVTESLLMENTPGIASTLQRLKDMGVTLSIDDFGTGYSSLSYLKRFPFNILKIDRSFVRDIDMDPEDLTLTRAIIAMAHALNLKVIAEGVENQRQLELLTDDQCDLVQGYLFSKPLNSPELLEFLNSHTVMN